MKLEWLSSEKFTMSEHLTHARDRATTEQNKMAKSYPVNT